MKQKSQITNQIKLLKLVTKYHTNDIFFFSFCGPKRMLSENSLRGKKGTKSMRKKEKKERIVSQTKKLFIIFIPS